MPNWGSDFRQSSVQVSIFDRAVESALDTNLLYETIIGLANEGLYTAGCLHAAAAVLLSDLGLPKYFFRNISRNALEQVLRTIAANLSFQEGGFVLRNAVADMPIAVDSNVRVMIAAGENRDYLEGFLTSITADKRVEYYYSSEHQYYTYVIRPERCPSLAEAREIGSCFAFCGLSQDDPVTPLTTRRRYESFLERCLRSPRPLVETSPSESTPETRFMFRDDSSRLRLPVIRRMLAECGMMLNRAYWETYCTQSDRLSSICSLYVAGSPATQLISQAKSRLSALMSIRTGELDGLYVAGELSFAEYLFAAAWVPLTYSFIHKSLVIDREAMQALGRPELKEALARRIYDAERAEYGLAAIYEMLHSNPEFIRELFSIFETKFNPRGAGRAQSFQVDAELESLRRKSEVLFVDDRTSCEIAAFMTRLVSLTLKTNYFKEGRRSCSFRLSPEVLDRIVFPERVYGVFFVVGFYAVASHLRAEDVARGGVRLIRVTAGNYDAELDGMLLLNYALGPVAQRLKHKDIAESGAKGVIVPFVEYARDGLDAVLDMTEGIADLTEESEEVLDYLGTPERVFYGPDEGTAPFMDRIAERARERGDFYWRTATTGKSIGIPHDVYGLTNDGRIFGLKGRGAQGTELEFDGQVVLRTTDMSEIYHHLGDKVLSSGMTTTSVNACFRELLSYCKLKESELCLMMTGGPSGDLGANQIQSFAGRISLIIDADAVLFDPAGLDRQELLKLCFARHSVPRLGTLSYPPECLSSSGFRIPNRNGVFTLPEGRSVDDGVLFHRSVLFNPELRECFAAAKIQAFIPCGGFKDTINGDNVLQFLELFPDLRVIVEGANVFFNDKAREVISQRSNILQIRDSSANKGGVTSSSLAEVLPALLLGERYEEIMVNNTACRTGLIRSLFEIISQNAESEARILLALREKTGEPLYQLSRRTSEQLLTLQKRLYQMIESLVANERIYEGVIKAYVPPALLAESGIEQTIKVLNSPKLVAYRNAIVTKKLAALALYRHALGWNEFLDRLEESPLCVLEGLLP